MANQRLVVEIIGSAIADAIERSQSQSLDRLRAAWDWVKQTAAAPPGLVLVAPDGSTYTGLVFVERSRAVLMIALYQPTQTTRHPIERASCPTCARHSNLFDNERDSNSDEHNPFYRR
jgi:hypothetical protein